MGIFYSSSAQTLHSQVGDKWWPRIGDRTPGYGLRVQDIVSVGSGGLFKSFLHNSAATIQF